MIKTRIVVAGVIALGVAGCGSVASRSVTPPSAVVARFSGHWVLDRQSSDDVHARLTPLFQRNEERWRRNAEKFDLPPPSEHGDSDQSLSNVRWLQGERQKEIKALVTFAIPASQIDIQASEHEMRFANNKGEGTRLLTPGEATNLFVPVGGFNVLSGWKDGTFVIESRGEGENKIHVVENYRLSVDNKQLEERLEVHLPNISNQVFHIVYRRE
ncbi:MAG TPA: hypothetical protein VET48_12770 [Steroidobacteraceae bacterium]|nr:hypothetical protein [Steroidobacteraceae bacterium]